MNETLLSESLPSIVRRLVEHLHPEQIVLFGSYANGIPHEDSDLDLMVIVSESDEPIYRRARTAYKALRGTLIPTDIVVLTRQEVNQKIDVPGSLVNRAMNQGKVLYGPSKAG